MRALGAVRLSRMTDESTSLERQTEAIEHTVQARGDTLIHITSDPDVSGAVSPFSRAGLGPWLNGRSDEWDCLVIHKLDSRADRLARSPDHPVCADAG